MEKGRVRWAVRAERAKPGAWSWPVPIAASLCLRKSERACGGKHTSPSGSFFDDNVDVFVLVFHEQIHASHLLNCLFGRLEEMQFVGVAIVFLLVLRDAFVQFCILSFQRPVLVEAEVAQKACKNEEKEEHGGKPIVPDPLEQIAEVVHRDKFCLHVVTAEAFVGQGFVFGAGTAVVGIGEDADAAAGGEETGDLDVFGLHEAHEVFHDDIDAVFMEVAVVAEGEEVEFQALAFDHALAGNVGDANLGKVGLAGDGAEGGELRTVETHPIVVVGMLVDEGFEHFGSVVVGILCALAAEVLQAFCFAGGHREKEGVIFLFANRVRAPRDAVCTRGSVRNRRPPRRCSR